MLLRTSGVKRRAVEEREDQVELCSRNMAARGASAGPSGGAWQDRSEKTFQHPFQAPAGNDTLGGAAATADAEAETEADMADDWDGGYDSGDISGSPDWPPPWQRPRQKRDYALRERKCCEATRTLAKVGCRTKMRAASERSPVLLDPAGSSAAPCGKSWQDRGGSASVVSVHWTR